MAKTFLMRNSFRLMLSCLFICILTVSCDNKKEDNPKKKIETISIGTVLPLTGDYSEYGKNVLAALHVAQDEINKKGKIHINIVSEDGQAEPAKAVNALQKLISIKHVKFIIGGFTSGCSQAMYPMAERNGVLMFSPSSSTPALTKNTPLFFRNWPTDQEQARFFASYTLDKFGMKSADILYSNSDYGVNAKSLFSMAFNKIGGNVPIEEAYLPKSTDYRAQINQFLAHPSDCIWLFGYYTEIGRFLKQARELGLNRQFFGQEGIEGQALIDIAGDAANGLIYFVPDFDPNSQSERMKTFVHNFRAIAHHDPEVFAAHAYDALNILVQGILAAGNDPLKVAQYLPTITNYPGLAGSTSIDANGDAQKSLMIKIIRNGRFIKLNE